MEVTLQKNCTVLRGQKIVGNLFGLSYLNITGNNQVENSYFFRISNISVPCPHAQLRGRTVIEKLWTFFGPWGRDRHVDLFGYKSNIHQYRASERTTRLHLNLLRNFLWPSLGRMCRMISGLKHCSFIHPFIGAWNSFYPYKETSVFQHVADWIRAIPTHMSTKCHTGHFELSMHKCTPTDWFYSPWYKRRLFPKSKTVRERDTEPA